MGYYNEKFYEESKTNAQIDCPACGRVVPWGGWHTVIFSSSKSFCSLNCFKVWADMNSTKPAAYDDNITKKNEIEKESPDLERIKKENLREEEQLEHERELQRIEYNNQQEELQKQREQLEEQKKKRQESMRLDYCGHCHTPVIYDYEEILINNDKFRIHKSCMDAFKKSGSDMYKDWQKTNKRLEEERLRAQKEYEDKKAAVEKWLVEDEEGKIALKEFIESHSSNIEEKAKIESLYDEMISLQRRREIIIRDNEVWIKNTDEGKAFDKECTEKNPRKRQELIKAARIEYERKQAELKKEIALEKYESGTKKIPVVSKLENILTEVDQYFEVSKKEQIETLLNESLKKIDMIETLEELKKYESIKDLELEKIPAKKKLWKKIIRVYVDVVMAFIFGGIGFAYIFTEPNFKYAVIFLTLAVLFLTSPLIGKIVTEKQTTSITLKNIAKLKEILEK